MIFVIAEHKDNKLKPITSELLVFAQRVGPRFRPAHHRGGSRFGNHSRWRKN